MNAFTKATVGVLMLASLSLTACGSNVPSDQNRNGYPGATASASAPATSSANPTAQATFSPEALKTVEAKETASPEEAAKIIAAAEAKPLGIDVDKAFAEYGDPKIDQTFPKKDFDTKEGVRFALSTYSGIVNTKNFYVERDGSKDWSLLNIAGEGVQDGKSVKVASAATSMTKETADDIQAGIKKYGRIIVIPNADSKGSFGTTADGTVINPVNGDMPRSAWNIPAVKLGYDKALKSNTIDITGRRDCILLLESGKTVKLSYDYQLAVVPSGDKKWLVSGIGHSNVKAVVVTADEAAKVLNG